MGRDDTSDRLLDPRVVPVACRTEPAPGDLTHRPRWLISAIPSADPARYVVVAWTRVATMAPVAEPAHSSFTGQPNTKDGHRPSGARALSHGIAPGRHVVSSSSSTWLPGTVARLRRGSESDRRTEGQVRRRPVHHRRYSRWTSFEARVGALAAWVGRPMPWLQATLARGPAGEEDPEGGQGLAEYALILAFIAIAVIGASAFFGEQLLGGAFRTDRLEYRRRRPRTCPDKSARESREQRSRHGSVVC